MTTMAIKRTVMTVPKIGVHEGVPASIYHSWDACSFSRLSKMRQSAAHCLQSFTGNERTPAMILGDAIHLAVLQPELFDEKYAIAGPCTGTTAKGEPCRNMGSTEWGDAGWRCGTHRPKDDQPVSRDVLSEEEWAKCQGTRDSILAHGYAGRLIECEGPRELSIVWRDPETDTLCKGRVDKYAPEVATIADLKSTMNARRDEFNRKIFTFGYYLQAPMYLDGMAAVGLPCKHFVLLPVEKSPPFACAAYRVMDDVVQAGREHVRELMQQYAACLDTGHWPGYSDVVEDIDLPTWDWKKLEETESD